MHVQGREAGSGERGQEGGMRNTREMSGEREESEREQEEGRRPSYCGSHWVLETLESPN